MTVFVPHFVFGRLVRFLAVQQTLGDNLQHFFAAGSIQQIEDIEIPYFMNGVSQHLFCRRAGVGELICLIHRPDNIIHPLGEQAVSLLAGLERFLHLHALTKLDLCFFKQTGVENRHRGRVGDQRQDPHIIGAEATGAIALTLDQAQHLILRQHRDVHCRLSEASIVLAAGDDHRVRGALFKIAGNDERLFGMDDRALFAFPLGLQR